MRAEGVGALAHPDQAVVVAGDVAGLEAAAVVLDHEADVIRGDAVVDRAARRVRVVLDVGERLLEDAPQLLLDLVRDVPFDAAAYVEALFIEKW